MSPENQILVPPSFTELFLLPGSRRLREPAQQVAARYELCEDMAQMLTEQAAALRFDLGVTETDVLDRIRAGLLATPAVFEPPEAGWIVCRLAELLGWPMPTGMAAPP